MSISDRYVRYLDHFGETTTLAELAIHRDTEARGLRHDVDHDLDVALDMAALEADRGVRASYYLLHTAPYFSDPRLGQKVQQLRDYGHEIGLHINLLTEWFAGTVDDVDDALARLLHLIREFGVDVVGVSAHGDRSCYENGFINYWCFEELRGQDPHVRESGLSAEGIPVADQAFQVAYPLDHRLVRADGRAFDFWSVSMAHHGLNYVASDIRTDGYFSDSGGGFTRTVDPLTQQMTSGRHQILMHPIHWRAEPDRLFVLSTARCGSTWLSHVIDESTSALGLHEHSLNHEFRDGELTARKRTASGFVDLLDDAVEVRRLLQAAAKWGEEQGGDVVEANVYLPHVLDEVASVWPDARGLHLVRHPRAVVESILARGWYTSAADDRHPTFGLPGWGTMTQFERCCWYVRLTNDFLDRLGLPVVRLEDVSGDRERLVAELRSADIHVHSRLLESFEDVRNANSTDDDLEPWSADFERVFSDVCGPLVRRYGYESQQGVGAIDSPPSLRSVLPVREAPSLRVDLDDLPKPLTSVGLSPLGPRIYRPDGDRHGYLLFAGGGWNRCLDTDGWPADQRLEFEGHCELILEGGEIANLFLLEFDALGDRVGRHRIADLALVHRFGFRTSVQAHRFNLAVHFPADRLPQEVVIQHFEFEGRTFNTVAP